MDVLEYLIRVRGGDQADRETDKASRGFERLRREVVETKIATGSLGFGLNNVSARLRTAGVAAVFAAPAILAVGSSAGAAAIGGGAVAGGGVAGLVVGLSGLMVVGKRVADGFSDVSSALDAYHLSVAQSGRGSKEAANALSHLFAVVGQSGGSPVLALVREVDALGSSWDSSTRMARTALLGTYADAIKGATRLMPTFARETNASALVVRNDLGVAIRQLSGQEVRSGISDLSNTFRIMFGPLTRGGTDLFIVLLRWIRTTSPYVEDGAVAFERWAHGLRSSSGDSYKLSTTMGMLVSNTRSWWGLVKAVGSTIAIVFGASVKDGQRQVDSLTLTVLKFNEWLTAAEKSGDVTRYIHEGAVAFDALATAAVPVAGIIGMLAGALFPAVQSGAHGAAGAFGFLFLRLQAIAAIIHFLGPLAGPMVQAWIAWTLATKALTAAQIALGIAFRLTPLGWAVTAITLLAAGFYLAYVKVGWFHRAVDNSFSWIKSHWPLLLAILTGPFGGAVALIVTHFDEIKSAAKSVFGFIARLWNSTAGKISVHAPGWVPGIGGKGFSVPKIPGYAMGTPFHPGGPAVIGERGPEILNLPRGSSVTPIMMGSPSLNIGSGDIVLKVAGRELARINRREILKAQAAT